MKDIVIKGKRVKAELIIFAICIVVVSAWNAYSIYKYNTAWSELYSVWYAVLFVAVVMYVVLIPLRFLVCKLSKCICKKSCKCCSKK